MKYFAVLACGMSLFAAEAPVTLQTVHTVYVFPMANGMDQYLTNRLIQEHVFQVTTLAKNADAVLTDRLGPAFEQQFDRAVLDKKPDDNAATIHAAMTRARGTIFLVGRNKQVIWSSFHPPHDASARQMQKAARRSVDQLKKDLQPVTPAVVGS